jgi:hypothetical protein
MTRFVVGDDRSQSTLFPERLDDYLGGDNPVRAIDVFVDELDLAKLGFGGVERLADDHNDIVCLWQILSLPATIALASAFVLQSVRVCPHGCVLMSPRPKFTGC